MTVFVSHVWLLVYTPKILAVNLCNWRYLDCFVKYRGPTNEVLLAWFWNAVRRSKIYRYCPCNFWSCYKTDITVDRCCVFTGLANNSGVETRVRLWYCVVAYWLIDWLTKARYSIIMLKVLLNLDWSRFNSTFSTVMLYHAFVGLLAVALSRNS